MTISVRSRSPTGSNGWIFRWCGRPTPVIGHRLKPDPKVTADQRGDGVGVAIEEYTKTSVKGRAPAAKKLEEKVLGKGKVMKLPRRKAS